ncbi:uncharacterized protein LOC123445643 isoform X1 [Hordeum vulgare subsp. vulgare]|uniref:uncharacterized protein LOC123445643 isoform X1 n=1 Tax=Hordeum vulgare subsp. vulgare TaxID=112509 RepID=UPI001D1A5485|nr:uncharacterized protein LOC123445643 isoform X1 [Hordeum vulgare subsp. vulgare]
MSGGGSSRPDAAAGGFPAGAARGAPGAGTEPPSLAQYLSLDQFPVGEHRHSRSAELRRALTDSAEQPLAALAQGKPLPPSVAEELRRIRGGVAESSARAKYTDRVKSLQESIQKLDKYKNVVTRRRQRSDGASADRASGSVGGSLRIGAQNSVDNPVQRLEERAKSSTMSKRVRSSLTADARLEGRVSISTRQGGSLVDTEKNPPLEKDKSSVRTANATSGFSEDKLRGLAPGGEGWEKKMKRKRSVGTMLNRGSDVDRDVKPSVQHRSNSEVRGRSSDAIPFRHGASAGASGGNKMDGSSQLSSSGSRYLLKTDMDSTPLPNERRERHGGLDKERVLLKGNKAHISEDMQPGTLSPVTKGKATRAPRTSSLVGIHSSSTLLRSAGGVDEWEEAPCTNKASPLGSTTNRKRPMAATASSPPVAWVGQRPQKMSRTRRANVVSPVSNFDDPVSEGSPIDVAVRPALETPGLLLPRGAASNNSQAASRMDNVTSPAGLSESEGSVATEHRNKEKVTNSGDFDNEGTNSAHVASDLIFSSKKSRIPLKEELEDGSIRRQGRSGRGTMHVKGCSPVPKEKLDNTETRKLVKSVRPASEKNESKLGRPPTKKGSDRKASSRHPEILNCGSIDTTGESEDDREELLAAANAARGAIVGAYAGPFWKKIEPMLTFISSEDLSFLKNQIIFLEELEMGMSNKHEEDKLTASTNYNGPPSMVEHSSQVLPPSNSSLLLDQGEGNGVGPRESVDILSYNGENHHNTSQKAQGQGIFGEMAPLTSRLLSALIVEDVDDFPESNGVQGDILLEFSNDYLPCAAAVEFEATGLESSFVMSPDFKHSNSNPAYNSMSNGFAVSSNLRGSYSQSSVCSENLSDGINVMGYPENGSLHGSVPQITQQYQTPGKDLSLPLYGYQYAQMSLHDRTLVELHSIDIFPEMPELDEGEDEDINKVILELQKRLFDQVNQKKCQLNKLEKAIRNTKNMEERSLEQHAMNKLVERAYKKLLGGRGSSSHKGGLSKAASKAAKQLALAFAKRTLARCQKFEETEKSCFREPFLWSVLSAPLPKSDPVDGGPPGSADRPKSVKLDRSPLSQGSTKWKKGERERDQSRDGSAKNSSSKSGRNSSGSGRNERKTKMKPKQKLAQLSTSGNVLGRVTEPSNSSFPSPSPRESNEWNNPLSTRPTQQPRNSAANIAPEPLDAPMNLPPMDPMVDILDVPEGNDISAWFTDGLDDSLQDFDFSGGLEIPDDDLTQLGFM